MHELSIAEGLREILEEEAERQGFSKVLAVRLEVGRLSCVAPEALRFCFEEVMRGSVAEGSALEIVEIPGVGWCERCRKSLLLEAFEPVCPACGGLLEITGGREVRVVELLGSGDRGSSGATARVGGGPPPAR